MNIPVARPDIGQEEIDAAVAVMRSGMYTGGKRVKAFEAAFAEYCGTQHAVAVGNGTDALILTLYGARMRTGSDVIVPALTFFATVAAVIHAGMRPVFADIDPETYCIDVEHVKELLSRRTGAIIPVHLYGHPAAMDELNELVYEEYDREGTCKRRQAPIIIEDAAQAHGAEYKGKKTGSLGHAACFDSRTMIKTIDGKKRICDVKTGDFVLTHKGRYRAVTEIHKRHYEGDWTILSCGNMRRTSLWTERSIRATAEHPLLIYRNGEKQWLSIKDVVKEDWVYTWTKKCELCEKKIPFFWRLCEYCNPAQLPASRDAISKSKDQGKSRPRYRHKHYYDDILPYANKLKENGFRVIPIGDALPDIIALKDGKVYAYEIENQLVRKRKKLKYNEREQSYYDEIIWITPKRKPSLNKNKCRYVIEDNLARVPINKIIKERRPRRLVYNLSVDEDESYFASNIAVHNCFSFFATKNMTTVEEGGMVTTDSGVIAKYVETLRNHGMVNRNDHMYVGYNNRLGEIGGAVGLIQLRRLDEMNAKRSENSEYLHRELGKLNLGWMKLPTVQPHVKHSWFWYPILIDEDMLGLTTLELRDFLQDAGIGTRHRYVEPLYKQPAMKPWEGPMGIEYSKLELPNVEAIAGKMLGLPNHQKLLRSQLDYIIQTIKEIG